MSKQLGSPPRDVKLQLAFLQIRASGWHLPLLPLPIWRDAVLRPSACLSELHQLVCGATQQRGRLMAMWAGGPPNTNTHIVAFVLPLSLFVGMLVTVVRVTNGLDERFIREVRVGCASVCDSNYCIFY
jgi:hypothetical protein